MARNSYGTGSIEQRGDTYRLRYSVNGRKFANTLKPGTSKTEARKQLRALLGQADTGQHVAPSDMTVNDWLDQWIAIGAPGRKKEPVSAQTLERYCQLLNEHVRPDLGARKIQQLQPTEIDAVYTRLRTKVSPWTKRQLSSTTARHVHSVFAAALATAERSGIITASPMKKTQTTPKKGEVDHGVALDADELSTLVAGFKSSSLYAIVAAASSTGARRNAACVAVVRFRSGKEDDSGRRVFTIFGIPIQQFCWMLACQCTESQRGSAMIQRRCCGSMRCSPSGRMTG